MFNLQLFGDNDTLKSSEQLKIGLLYAGEDTNIISLKNPKTNVTAEQIEAAFSDVTTTKILVGDRDGSAFLAVSKAYIEETTDRILDLS